ncbi:FtsX-like permease family protein [Isoptericola chiayiensis]|uniref:FtsX-like permease family protein n=1 Tax=Isoptericola chiayiensis TaxID=579446 RepID=A0ABP8Y2I2_9MICO|nr:ABC transporter permease [Isoptericola chiayiensis]NOV99353.1 putative ABC transport system permease protein [Isoptericola chiayiensis]
MLRITLAQMRRSAGRLTAAGVAIVIGTAFVAATLLASGVITRMTYDSIAAQYGDADLVVGASEDAPLDVDALATTDGVAAVAPVTSTYAQLTDGARSVYQSVVPTADDRLMPLEVTEGGMPAGPDEIALPTDVAERLDVAVGDTVDVGRDVVGDDGSWQQVTETPTVVGLLDDPFGAYSQTGGAAVVDASTYTTWQTEARGEPAPVTEAAVVVADGADLSATRSALAGTIGGATSTDSSPWVVTTDERAAESAAELTDGQDLMFLVFVLTFAAIALVVAGLVIANTFQVLVAQRARTLALLRCVGADKAQVGRGVLVEAGILGLIASVAGVLLGTALGQAALWVAHAMDVPVPLPDTVTLTWQVVVIPVLVGTLVTVGAAVVPARVATRVAPLAALRPAASPSTSRRAGKVRPVLSLLAAVVGFALLGGGAALGTLGQEPTLGLLAGIAGGALSFVGVAVGAVFWLPKVAAAAGRLVGASGPTARLAAANTLRNPRRTATTSTALLIGVTLVAMMSTGAASARVSLTAALDEQFPVDVMVASTSWDADGAPAAIPADLRAELVAVDGVTAAVDVQDSVVAEPGGQRRLTAVDTGDARAVLNSPQRLDGLTEGTALVGSDVAGNLDDGDSLELTGPDGVVSLAVVLSDSASSSTFVTPADLARLDADVPASEVYLALDDDVDAVDAVGAIQDVVADSGESAQVTGIASQRAMFDQVIDTMLGIVLGLLAVAVVIALIGVANTLSLSVLERRRESATLRAIGLSRAQLRGMLAVEGLLIAGVGAVLGVVLGLVYGWAGAAAALGVMGDVTLSVPWRDVVLVLLVALLAGLVASVAPARTALKASPVEALATE